MTNATSTSFTSQSSQVLFHLEELLCVVLEYMERKEEEKAREKGKGKRKERRSEASEKATGTDKPGMV